MKQIWEAAIIPMCLPASLLCAGLLLYWMLGLLGVVGDGFDGDDAGSSDADGDDIVHGLASITLKLLNARGVPFMLVITILSIYLWGGLVWGTMQISNALPFHSLILPLGSTLGACVLTSVTAIPLKPLFAKLHLEDAPHVPIVGRVGTVRSNEITSAFGQVEVQDKHGPMFINARLSNDQISLPKNSPVLIISLDQEKLVYTVIPADPI